MHLKKLYSLTIEKESEFRLEKERTPKKSKMDEAEENEPARAPGLLFGRLDFRVTRIMILVAAAGSRIAYRRGASILEMQGCFAGAREVIHSHG